MEKDLLFGYCLEPLDVRDDDGDDQIDHGDGAKDDEADQENHGEVLGVAFSAFLV